jgi:hypothetical protein
MSQLRGLPVFIETPRRSRLRWEPTRRDAIFLRVVTLARDGWIPRGETAFTFIMWLSVDSDVDKTA